MEVLFSQLESLGISPHLNMNFWLCLTPSSASTNVHENLLVFGKTPGHVGIQRGKGCQGQLMDFTLNKIRKQLGAEIQGVGRRECVPPAKGAAGKASAPLMKALPWSCLSCWCLG